MGSLRMYSTETVQLGFSRATSAIFALTMSAFSESLISGSSFTTAATCVSEYSAERDQSI